MEFTPLHSFSLDPMPAIPHIGNTNTQKSKHQHYQEIFCKISKYIMLRYTIKHVKHIQMQRNDINKLFSAIPPRRMHYPHTRGPGKSGQGIKHKTFWSKPKPYSNDPTLDFKYSNGSRISKNMKNKESR